MTVNSMKCISWSRLAIFTAAMAVLSSCGGGQSGMKLGDDEFTVVAVQSTASQQSTSYPATIKGVQDIEVRPQVSGFIVKLCVDCWLAVDCTATTVNSSSPNFIPL